MAVYGGIIRDLVTGLREAEVCYDLLLGEESVPLNPLIGRRIRLAFEGEKRCVYCGRKATKLFNAGSCWPCFQRLAINDLCQVKPELCHFDTCRQPEWGEQHCMIPTYVYLAKSSDIKVGITRNIPGRWLDQGAVEAVLLALVPTRKMAGELEVALTRYVADKTNWRKMLKGEVSTERLLDVRDRILPLIPEDFRGYILHGETMRSFQYPATVLPEKIASHDVEKGPADGRLLGIKGSYLILDTGVLNVPKFTGYKVSLQVSSHHGSVAG